MTEAGTSVDKADPFARMSEPGGNASVIVAPTTYTWSDAAWVRARAERRPEWPVTVYEVHLSSWRRGAGGRLLGYRELAEPLAEHARTMGFTHVQLMPVMEHASYPSWGYNVTGYVAPTSRHGEPDDLRALVDTLHRAKLGVILDFPLSSFAQDAHGLSQFDGAPLFEGNEPGTFDLGRPEVQSFLASSATFWLEEMHVDGLRITGAPPQAADFLRDLVGRLRSAHAGIILVGDTPGLGFDAVWDPGPSRVLRGYLGHDPIIRSRHQGALTAYAPPPPAESAPHVLALSHDDCVDGAGGSVLAQLHGDPWQRLANLRLLYSMLYALPGQKLFFMGNEMALPQSWHHDRALSWASSQDGIARMVGDLNHLYREDRALQVGGFTWIETTNELMSVVLFGRDSDDDHLAIAFNGTPVPRPQYRIGVPRGGVWREIFNSDAKIYGGSGHGNLGEVEAVPFPWNDRDQSVVVTLPPLGLIMLKADPRGAGPGELRV